MIRRHQTYYFFVHEQAEQLILFINVNMNVNMKRNEHEKQVQNGRHFWWNFECQNEGEKNGTQP